LVEKITSFENCVEIASSSILKIIRGGERMKIKLMDKIIKIINFSVKVDANSTSTTAAYQPKLPKEYQNFKKQ
jgi:cyclic lactone autoinducer peptide